MIWSKLKSFFTNNINIGERACYEAFSMIAENNRQRNLLRENGWTISEPYLVNNETLWYHPQWMYKTQSEAIKYILK